MRIPYYLLLALLFSFCSCESEGLSPTGSDNRTLPKSNGGRLELVVVMEDYLWSGAVGEAVKRYFLRAQDGLPQVESIFRVMQVNPKEFNRLLKNSKNIIYVKLGEAKQAETRDQFARPQTYAYFSAPTEEELVKVINDKGPIIAQNIHDFEVSLMQQSFKKALQKNPGWLEQKGINMGIPQSFSIEKQEEDLIVLWNKSRKSDQGLFIHVEPLNHDKYSLGQRILPLRDSLTAIHFLGEREGSFMRVEDFIPPVFNNTKIDDQFAIETRGLWRTEGDFMGGPFLSYTIYNELSQQKVTIDAFFYGPELKKRNFMLELEAVLKSLEFIN